MFNDVLTSDNKLEKRLNFTQSILAALLLVVIAVPIIGSWWLSQNLNQINGVAIDNARVIGQSALCAGDLLVIQYDFHADGAGKLLEDATVWQEEPPPKTVIYSESKEILLEGEIDQVNTLAWRVPVTYTNPATLEDTPLPAGRYRRIFAVSSPSRSTAFALASVAFTIKDKCN